MRGGGQTISSVIFVLVQQTILQLTVLAPLPHAGVAQKAVAADAAELQLGQGDGRLKRICDEDAPQYSGFLSAGQGNSYFYWLAESRSAMPSSDPLILWMTGGPGCSSTLAALTENGPCRVKSRSPAGLWDMEQRPESWTEAANVVWVDQPGGVGYSGKPGLAGLVHNETEVGDNMFAFLQSLYGRFPQFLDVPFFIFGESYAGHYVPAVAARILRGRAEGVRIPLAGVGIGNGLVSPAAQFFSKPQMAHTGGAGGSLGEGVVNESVYSHMLAAMPTCTDDIHKCQESDEKDKLACLYAYMYCTLTEMLPVLQSGRNPYDLRKGCPDRGNPLCYNETLETLFMNDPKVQEAFGVYRHTPWAACNLTVTLQFMLSGDYLRDLRHQVVELLAAGVGVLVYNGDDDFMVDWLGSKLWMEDLQWPHKEEWTTAEDKGFLVDGQKRGVVRTAHGLTFLQIYNAGHLVPMDQPKVALAMVREFLSASSPWNLHTEVELAGSSTPSVIVAPMSMVSVALVTVLFTVGFLISRFVVQRPGPIEDRPYLLLA